MRKRIAWLVWLAAVAVAMVFLSPVFSLGADAWRMGLLMSIPLLLLAAGSVPLWTKGGWRRAVLYPGIIGCIAAGILIFQGMFMPGFAYHFLIGMGCASVLFLTAAFLFTRHVE